MPAASVLVALAALLAPADPASTPRSLALRAQDLADHGDLRAGIELLLAELSAELERSAGGGLAAAEGELAALALSGMTVASDDWERVGDALEALRPPADAAQRAVARLDQLRARARWIRGDGEGARALCEDLGYVYDWLLIGPFDNERGGGHRREQPLESSSAPLDLEAELAGKERPVRWRASPGAAAPLPGLSLHELLRPREQVLAYLATGLRAEEARDVGLLLGSTGPWKVFLNGRELAGRDVEREPAPDQDAVVLPLAAGWNRLVVKAGVEQGPWRVEARLIELDGRPARGLEVASARAVDAPPAPREATGAVAPGARELLEAEGQSARALAGLALYHLTVHPDDREALSAREAARAAVELAPDDAAVRHLLASALRPPSTASPEEMRVNPRLEVLREVLALDEGHPEALLGLAKFYTYLDPIPERADELSRRALEAAPGSLEVLGLRANVLEWRGRDAEAELVRRARLEREGALLHPELLLESLERRRRRGDADGALEALLERVAARPGEGAPARRAVDWLVDAGRVDEAFALSERHFALQPLDVEGLLRAAARFEHAGRVDLARGTIQRALALCPEDTAAWRARVRLAERAGDVETAAAGLEEVLRLDPGDDKARRHLQLLREEDREAFERPWRRDALELAALPLPETGENDLVELLDRTTVYLVHADGTEHRYEHLVLRALGAGGVKRLDRVPIWYPADSSVQVFEARVIHPDGTFERAPAPTGRDPSNGAWRQRVFDLPPLAAGDLIDLEYRVDERDAGVFGQYFGTRHEFYPDLVDPLAPTRRSELVVVAPPEVPLHWAVRHGERLEFEERVDERGRTVLRWVARDLTRPAPEGSMPGRSELAPVVDVTTYASWDEFAVWWWSFIQKEFVTTPAMRDKVRELCEGKATERERIEAIARFVGQEIRYNAWAFGTHGYEPFSAATIFERRFGDCKDKSILLRQMLAEIGVEAVPVLLDAEYRRPREPLEAAMVGQFDHCIAYLPPTDERPGLYLDATADRNPIDYLRADDQGARVLHVTPAGGELHEIPYAAPEENALRRVYDVELRADGTAHVVLQDESNGSYGVRLRYLFGGEQGEVEQNLARLLRDGFGQVDVLSVETSDLEDIAVAARLSAELETDVLWTEEAGGRGLPVSFDEIGLERALAETAEERTWDLVLDRPFAVETVVRYHLPAGAAVARLPEDADVEAPGLVGYRQTARATDDGAVEVVRRFELRTRRVGTERYGALRDALHEIRAAEERTVTIRLDGGEGGGR